MLDDGCDALPVEYAKASRELPVGVIRIDPEEPVQVVQPAHLAVNCQ